MSMKPIASRRGEWCVSVGSVSADGDMLVIGYPSPIYGKSGISILLPDGLTFAQFLDQYNRCTDNIYFID